MFAINEISASDINIPNFSTWLIVHCSLEVLVMNFIWQLSLPLYFGSYSLTLYTEYLHTYAV